MSEEMQRTQPAAQTADQRRDAFVERLSSSVLGAAEMLSIYIGERMGLYQALADGAAATAPELADAAGIHERYAREWLEQQAVCAILEVEDAQAEPNLRRYRLPKGHDEVLLQRDSLNYIGASRARDSELHKHAARGDRSVQDGWRSALLAVR